MLVKQVSLTNFRNYARTVMRLDKGRTILIGDNAQGKSNFLEALEIASFGSSSRTNQDTELIRWGQSFLELQVVFERQGQTESICLTLKQNQKPGTRSVAKEIKVNGVTQPSVRSAMGRLVAVIFTTQDLNLLRG